MGASELWDDDEDGNGEESSASEGAEADLVDEEPLGPEPVEYKPVLIFAVVLVVMAGLLMLMCDGSSSGLPYILF